MKVDARPHEAVGPAVRPAGFFGEGEQEAEESVPGRIDLVERAAGGLQPPAGAHLPGGARQVVGAEVVVFDLDELDARVRVDQRKVRPGAAHVGLEVEAPLGREGLDEALREAALAVGQVYAEGCPLVGWGEALGHGHNGSVQGAAVERPYAGRRGEMGGPHSAAQARMDGAGGEFTGPSTGPT